MDKISVIIPVYNVEKYLERVINSVLNQTYKEFEILLIDDGSTDGSGALCDKYAKTDARIKVVHKQNGGVSETRNKGIDCSVGKYITFIDADDYVEKDYLQKLYSALINEKAQISICCMRKSFEDKNRPDKVVDMWGEQKVFTGEQAIQFTSDSKYPVVGFVWGSLYDAEFLKKSGVRFHEDIHFCEDMLFKCELLCNDNIKVVAIPDIMYVYWIRGNSATMNSRKNIKKFASEIAARKQILAIANRWPGSELEKRTYFRLFSSYTNLIKGLFISDAGKEEEKKRIEEIKELYPYVKSMNISKKDRFFYHLIVANRSLAKILTRFILR